MYNSSTDVGGGGFAGGAGQYLPLNGSAQGNLDNGAAGAGAGNGFSILNSIKGMSSLKSNPSNQWLHNASSSSAASLQGWHSLAAGVGTSSSTGNGSNQHEISSGLGGAGGMGPLASSMLRAVSPDSRGIGMGVGGGGVGGVSSHMVSANAWSGIGGGNLSSNSNLSSNILRAASPEGRGMGMGGGWPGGGGGAGEERNAGVANQLHQLQQFLQHQTSNNPAQQLARGGAISPMRALSPVRQCSPPPRGMGGLADANDSLQQMISLQMQTQQQGQQHGKAGGYAMSSIGMSSTGMAGGNNSIQQLTNQNHNHNLFHSNTNGGAQQFYSNRSGLVRPPPEGAGSQGCVIGGWVMRG